VTPQWLDDVGASSAASRGRRWYESLLTNNRILEKADTVGIGVITPEDAQASWGSESPVASKRVGRE